MAPSRKLKPGDVIANRYEIRRELATGGMGAVYSAVQWGLDRAVAIKVLKPEVAISEDIRKRFVREAKVSARFKHPGAVEIYDFGEDDGLPYLVMELLEGLTLGAYLNHAGRLSVAETIAFGTSLAETLAAAHALPLTHRDLKPENVFVLNVDGDPKLKLVDFGIAFIQEVSDVGRLTQDLMVSGTPGFIAPEQAQAKDVGPAADIYALGIMFYLMLSGRLPFTGTLPQLLAAHLYQTPQPLVSHGLTDIPRDMVHLIDAMMAKVPSLRPTAEDIVRSLAACRPEGAPRHGATYRKPEHAGETDRLGVPASPTHERDGRALPLPRSDTNDTASYDEEAVVQKPLVAVIGEASQDLLTALGMRSLLIVSTDAVGKLEPQLADISCCFVIDSSAIDDALALDVPVIAVRERDDIDAAAKLLRRGVADSVVRPIDSATAARKIGRAIGRAKRLKTRSRV